MKVLYSFPHVLGRPGIGSTAWYQVKGLIDSGVEVHLSCSALEKDVSGVSSVVETLKIAGVRIPRRLIGAERAWRLHDRLSARILHKFGQTIDVVHCWPSGSLTTIRRAKSLDITSFLERPSAHTAYVMHVSEQEFRSLQLEAPANHYSNVNQSRLELEENEFQEADYLLCPSDFVSETFIRHGYSPSKLLKHQYGYDPDIFYVRERASPKKLIFLYCGEGIPLKGLHIALDAWIDSGVDQLTEFWIAGTIMPELGVVLAPQLSHPNVRLLGFRGNISEIMRLCDVLLLPSLAEGSALVTYEARASGCVLMVSDHSGARCQDGVTGLVHKAGSSTELRDHIREFVHDSEFREGLRDASLSDISHWTWDVAGRKLANLYHEKGIGR